MDKKKKFILIGFSLLWAILLIWGIYKSYKISKAPLEETPLKDKLSTSEIVAKAREKKGIPSFSEEEKERLETPTLVRAFRVKKIDFKDALPVMGEIKAKAEIPLKFEINGVINKIYFGEADYVKKGALIASLNPKDAQLRLRYTENKLKSAQANYQAVLKKLEIYQELFGAGALIRTKLEEAELEAEAAHAQLETTRAENMLAEEELKKTNIYATIEGILGSKEAEEGEVVTPQDKIGSLLDVSEVFVEAGIVERDVFKVNVGQKVGIFVDAYPDKTFEGLVERIYPLVEGQSRTLTVKIRIINPGKLLLPGMFSRAEIFTVEFKRALIVPAISLVNTGGGIFLLPVISKTSLIKEEEGTFLGRVKLKTTKIGYLSSDYAQIMENLEEGDLVITEAHGELNDGTKVRVVGIEEFGE